MGLRMGDIVIPMDPRKSKKFLKECGIPFPEYTTLDAFIGKRCIVDALPADGTVGINNPNGIHLFWIRSYLRKVRRG
ncbi:MAG TPA: hypothetical protein ENH35_04220 [Candidatus Moranbacteria bacterium]|nr:hypothetical protein [Candidatus Moranbacteria bacterium]